MTLPTQATRTEALVAVLQRYMHAHRVSKETIAIEVVERYQAAVAPEARTVAFKTDGDPFRCATTNAQRLFRMLDPDNAETRFPADLEEALVASMPEPYRTDCAAALVRRHGSLYVPVPDLEGAVSFEPLGELVREFGATLTAMAPIVADGRIDEGDRPHLAGALDQIEQLLGGLLSMRARLQAVNDLPVAKPKRTGRGR